MVLGKLSVPGVPLIWIIVRQGPSVLAVGAIRGCLDIFSSSVISLLSPSLWTEILSHKAVKPKPTNQPIHCY